MKLITTLLLFSLLAFPVYLLADEHAKNNNMEVINHEQNQALERFIAELSIEQGIAHFTQKKHFTFLNNPIASKGLLKIHKNSVIWQVNKPVFSKLVIIEDQVWQLKSQNKANTPDNYQVVVSHASIETLIRAVFTGKINQSQWNAAIDKDNCLKLLPKDLILSQALNKIEVCVPENQSKRLVTIEDAQSNLTEIELMVITEQLSDEDIREFNINQ